MLAFFVVVGVLGGHGAGCAGGPVAIAVSLPNDLLEETTWFEVGGFLDATCAAVVPMLPNGIPEGVTARVAFKRDDPSPRFGDIPNGRYAFAAVARDANCTVLAAGCTEKEIDDVDVVSIRMTASDDRSGGCSKGASCQAAKCVPAIDNADPSIGAGCSLELLGAGPLATPIGGSGTLVSAPAIGATPTGGFIIGYREIDPNGAGARITILPIDPAGGALTPLRPALPNPCSTSEETDGVGLVVNGDKAMMALAKAPCGGNEPELQLLNFTTTPELGKFLVSKPSSDSSNARVILGAARPSAPRQGAGLVVFSDGSSARIANMSPENGIVGPNGTFGGPNVTDAWIAANSSVLALLAAGKGSGATPTVDAGADGGASPNDGSTSTLRLQLLPADTNIQNLTSSTGTVITFPGQWASIAASGGRVIVLSDGTGPGRSATYRAFDRGRDTVTDMNGFSVEGSEKVTAGDVALVGDRAYFAALKQGGVALHVFANATTTLTPLASVSFGREPRISAINTVRDGRVAVAATDRRVAVVWTNAKILGPNDGTGGYAVFGCSE